ncbi:hypothetical protein LZZ85_21550 [Terrimonas sp. NA20]|uniref:DUF4595 domain-containing protein n=1 Tax=Terrimonas ginsenosidimutans TaxID=2908004 RepID=A0ABS9KX10_9BACT|nr:hypothetical protein [Terrimonas ginsenosidimutans]MCG2616897.1 hypothetical protein [Terrimonas ginsenosidimutans]
MQATFIKRTVSRILLGIGLVASLVACKKDKNDNPGGPDNPNGTKIAMFSQGDEYMKFEYNTDGSVKKILVKTDLNTGGEELDFTVKYDAQKRIVALENQWQQVEVEYENNVMSKSTIKQFGTIFAETEYQFVNDNLKSSILSYAGEGDQLVPFLKYDMTYNGQGHLTKVATSMSIENEQFEPSGYITYQYDGKTNPLYEHRQLLTLFWYNISKENTTVEDHFDADQQPEDKFQYTYTYNGKGRPEKAKVKQGLPGGEQSEVEVKYTYK